MEDKRQTGQCFESAGVAFAAIAAAVAARVAMTESGDDGDWKGPESRAVAAQERLEAAVWNRKQWPAGYCYRLGLEGRATAADEYSGYEEDVAPLGCGSAVVEGPVAAADSQSAVARKE